MYRAIAAKPSIRIAYLEAFGGAAADTP